MISMGAAFKPAPFENQGCGTREGQIRGRGVADRPRRVGAQPCLPVQLLADSRMTLR